MPRPATKPDLIRVANEQFEKLMQLVDAHTGDELFSNGIFKWTKTSTLGAYFASNSSSHYDWAMKKIKKHIKALRAVG